MNPFPFSTMVRLRWVFAAVASLSVFASGWSGLAAAPIDRHALVSRHDVVWSNPVATMPLGDGEFAFNADGTGLQTFAGNTMAHWAWHSFPMPPGVTPEQIPPTGTLQKGRPMGGDPGFPKPVAQWLRVNPHSFNLGRLSLCRKDGGKIERKEIVDLTSRLDLWSGVQSSGYKLDGAPVRVITCVHPVHPGFDMVAVRIESSLLASGNLGVALDFPYPSLRGKGGWNGDFDSKEAHTTRLSCPSVTAAVFECRMDATVYHARLEWDGGNLAADPANPHHFVLMAKPGKGFLEIRLAYAPASITGPLPSFLQTREASATCWEAYWKSGGAIDLSGSKDPRWKELERRIVLSQYHMAAMSAGSFPPAESSLLGVDAWGSRFHMEMTWWHLAHYALWNRWPMAERALGVYERFLPAAKQRAQQLGMEGAVWPKGVGPNGISQPWHGNIALLWKQPHPIFFAELDYRLHPTPETLQKWAPIVQATADFMASYAQLDPTTGAYILKPDVPPGETGTTVNGVFDLAYWRWGFDAAQRWRQRMGLPREKHWDQVRAHLAPLPTLDGLFVHSSQWADTYTTRNYEHPDPVGVLGMVPPTPGVDPETAHRTVLKIFKLWQWNKVWGWDFPWTAMAAARVGEPKVAVDCLLMDSPKNRYDWRGICTGNYLPGNGGLLYAVAMMAAGWDSAPNRHAPGFPSDGSWSVRFEGLNPAP